MATTQLAVYRAALLHLGERRIASLTENVPARHALDDAWVDTPGHCLENGIWNFAIRSVAIDSDPSVDPGFGYAYAFAKPNDWVRTAQVSASDTFSPPMMGREFVDEAEYWYSDTDPIYVKFVSNGVNYGGDLSRWTQLYADYVAIRLARIAGPRVTASEARLERLDKLERAALSSARNKDAMNEGVGFPPMGSWASARLGGRSSRMSQRREG